MTGRASPCRFASGYFPFGHSELHLVSEAPNVHPIRESSCGPFSPKRALKVLGAVSRHMSILSPLLTAFSYEGTFLEHTTSPSYLHFLIPLLTHPTTVSLVTHPVSRRQMSPLPIVFAQRPTKLMASFEQCRIIIITEPQRKRDQTQKSLGLNSPAPKTTALIPELNTGRD